MQLRVDPDDEHIVSLCAELDSFFQVALPRNERKGFGACLNIADRVNDAMGFPAFRFDVINKKDGCSGVTGGNDDLRKDSVASNAISSFEKAVDLAKDQTLCGVDIGGTDIKAVGTINGRIAAYKEYDWNPAEATKIDQVIDPILLIVRVIRAALTLPDSERGNELRDALLDAEATDDEMYSTLEAVESEFGASILLDGIGMGFPDVVIRNKIVGGETLKTRGVRLNSPDYEAEFGRLSALDEVLMAQCKPGGVVNMTNDGFLAAYTAAVEIAHSEYAENVADGVFAHTLGTELGTGWIDENGDIPQIALEIYTCVIDMGKYPSREFDVLDLRSTRNFNTGIAGTMQKYTCQYGAYRLALDYFTKSSPDRYTELLEKGFIEEKNGDVYVTTSPKDMRKALLAHIMELADNGQPQAEEVFREIGRCLAAIWRESEFLARPRVKRRVLCGRFVKIPGCLSLMREGARESLDITLDAGDEDLAFTHLMKQLQEEKRYTVAQFGQAVGGVYFAAS